VLSVSRSRRPLSSARETGNPTSTSSPPNILVTDAGQSAAGLDFGVGESYWPRGETDQTTPSATVFARALTPDYASPSLLQASLLERSQPTIYCWACCSYELLTPAVGLPLGSDVIHGLASIGQSHLRIEIKESAMQLGASCVRNPGQRSQHGCGAARDLGRHYAHNHIR